MSRDSPPFVIKAWENHRTYPHEADEGKHTVRFLLSAEEVPQKAFKLNTLFFENWYKYQEEAMLQHGKLDIIQVLSVSTCSVHMCIPSSKCIADQPRYLMLAGHILRHPHGYHLAALFRRSSGSLLGDGWVVLLGISHSTESTRLIGIWLVRRWGLVCFNGGLQFFPRQIRSGRKPNRAEVNTWSSLYQFD